ncbi:YjhX family toxin [Amorphus sp. 3PC139-8]|uniref:YjhX family toxin n=1 Tax=Amorphus sp. 3PC139-8 TaxID=2735676 RepID=UPI00345C7DB7
MDISKDEQRVLHLLAQGGVLQVQKDDRGKVADCIVVTRDGWHWRGCSLPLFRKLKRRRLVISRGGAPYRITELGLRRVRAQLDNR